MRVLLLFVGLCVLGEAAAQGWFNRPQHPIQCLEGSAWFDGCNNCRCIKGGAACTKKFCNFRGKDLASVSPSCTDGSRWLQDNCNWCDCIEGAAVCTERFCLEDSSTDEEAASDAAEDNAVCQPLSNSDRWREQCNWCNCLPTGVSRCTKKGCPPVIMERLAGTEECQGSPSWKRNSDCNWCSCNNGIAECTEVHCPEDASSRSLSLESDTERDPTDVCDPKGIDHRWRDGCNWCSCASSKVVRCTKRGCPAFIVQRLEGTEECEGSPVWKRGCNWCRCNNGMAQCTEIACEERDPTDVCNPKGIDHRWRDGCNWCSCASSKVARCTKRGCPAFIVERLEGTKECEGSPEWKRDCNWCTCNNGIATCTSHTCNTPATHDTPAHDGELAPTAAALSVAFLPL